MGAGGCGCGCPSSDLCFCPFDGWVTGFPVFRPGFCPRAGSPGACGDAMGVPPGGAARSSRAFRGTVAQGSGDTSSDRGTDIRGTVSGGGDPAPHSVRPSCGGCSPQRRASGVLGGRSAGVASGRMGWRRKRRLRPWRFSTWISGGDQVAHGRCPRQIVWSWTSRAAGGPHTPPTMPRWLRRVARGSSRMSMP